MISKFLLGIFILLALKASLAWWLTIGLAFMIDLMFAAVTL